MNAHTPPTAFAPDLRARICDVDAAVATCSKIHHLAEALITIGDAAVREGDDHLGNMVATLAGVIQAHVKEIEADLGLGPAKASV